jgi:hypothetical protein
MFSPVHSILGRLTLAVALVAASGAVPRSQGPSREQVLDVMKRATTFMVDTVSTNGGYVWAYLPDLSRRWGELEARDTMIWIQPPGTATVGHLFLDAYHATGDEYYYAAAEKVAGALIWAQHPSGGWNYLADFAGDRSLRQWYDTIGRNAWRLEEFQHYWGNATFDDAGTADASKFLLRLYVEKRDPKYRPALDKAIRFVLDSQYPIGAWPQRYPRPTEAAHDGNADYTSFITFNDDVASENIEFLTMCYQSLGDDRVLDAITRGMSAFIVTQQGPPQPGWALQYTLDLKPAAARSYEPKALVTHTTATNVERMIGFYHLTGDTRFLARIPEALAWLERVQSPPGVAPAGRTHPTFIEIGTDTPLYVHRRGSNVVNGAYYVDHDAANTLGHYSAFRRIDLARLRELYDRAKATPPEDAARTSPLTAGRGLLPLPRFVTVEAAGGDAAKVLASLHPDGYWPAPLGYNSHPYTRPGTATLPPGDFATSHVGDETDTSPFPDPGLTGISTAAYIRNMGVLIRALDAR